MTSANDRWTVIDSTTVAGSDTELTLLQSGADFAIRIAGMPGDLMNSRRHHSEDMLAAFACAPLRARDNARILVGGLGMGFSLAAVLQNVTSSAEVIVAELVPAVVDWNKGALGQCAGLPLDDDRTRVRLGDVAELLKHRCDGFDAILLDVDNGPEAITHADNQWLYSPAGIQRLYEKLRPAGIVTIWSARADHAFANRLQKVGFDVQLRTVRARPGKGSRHTIFVAQRPH